MVAHRAAFDVEPVDDLAETVERGGVVERARHEADASCELRPHILTELGASVLLHRVVHDLREVLVFPVAACETDEREARGQKPPRFARSYTAGMSFFRDRSPVTPKMMRLDGPAMRFSRKSLGGAERVLARTDHGWLHARLRRQPIASRSVWSCADGSVRVRVSTGATMVGEHARVARRLRGDELAEGEGPRGGSRDLRPGAA